jgi:undecaprenyl-diphosphatase
MHCGAAPKLKPNGVRFLVPPIVALGLVCSCFGQPAVKPPEPVPTAVAELHTGDAILLGVIEGITEYLPVSSTGHLVIATHFLHLDSEAPLHGRNGEPLWFKKPSAKHPNGEPLTVKLAADTYSVVIQFGAIAAVALLYWTQIVSMIRGLFGLDPDGRRLLVHVLIAFFPAAVLGLLVHDWIDENLFSVWAVIVAQVLGAVLMLFAESWRKRHRRDEEMGLNQLTPKSALGIGALQCLSLWPGTSRSMTTIVGGYFAGLEPRRAAEFSFILGFVTLSAATVYKSYKSGAAMVQVFGWPHILIGCVVAAVVAFVSVRFLVSWLTRHGLALFAWYRIAVAIALAALFLR